jgi:toxin CcdB
MLGWRSTGFPWRSIDSSEVARFEVYRSRDGGLWLDCQADRLSHLQQRFVVPLVPPGDAPSPSIAGLNPVLDVNGVAYVMLPQFAGAAPCGSSEPSWHGSAMTIIGSSARSTS